MKKQKRKKNVSGLAVEEIKRKRNAKCNPSQFAFDFERVFGFLHSFPTTFLHFFSTTAASKLRGVESD